MTSPLQPRKSPLSHVRAWVASVVGLCLAGPLAGQTWDGQGNSNWTNAVNWSGNVAPVNNGTASVVFAGSTNTSVSVDGTAKSVASLGFAANASNFSFSGNTITVGTGGLNSSSSNTQTFANNIQLGDSQSWNIAAGTVVINGVFGTPWYMTFTKTGAGALELNSNNTLVGPTIVNGGVLRLGHNRALGDSNYGNEVNSGATLELVGGISVTESAFNLSGTGASGNGVLRSVSGNNSLASALTLVAASRIQVDADSLTLSDTLAMGANLTWAGAGNGTISSTMHGAGTFIKTGTGTLTFTGGSAISSGGGLVVEAGVVDLNRTASINAWNGPMVVGVDGATPGTATLRLQQNEQIANYLSATVHESGVFDLNNHDELITSVAMTGGTIQTGTGTLKVSGGSAVTTSASTYSATITGNLELQAHTGTFDVANGAASNDLVVNGVISSTGAGHASKSGAGTMVMSGSSANTFSGNFTITNGTVALAKSGGVNSISGSGLVINSGGTLLYQADNQIATGTAVTMAGGTFNLNGHVEGAAGAPGLGTLTLTNDSVFDLGSSGSALIAFANSSGVAVSWVGGKILTFQNWSGSTSGGGTDQVYFGSSITGLTDAQLAQIKFLNPAGYSAGVYASRLLSTGELVPFVAVPEPGTWLAGFGLVGLVAGWEIRRRRRRT